MRVLLLILRLKLRLLASCGRLVAARERERARERKRAATALSGSSGSLSLRALLPVWTRSVSVRAAADAVTCAVGAPAARTCTCRGVLLQQHLWLGAAFAWRRHELEERLAVFEVDCWRRRSLLLLLLLLLWLHAARHNDVVSAALRRNVEHRERCLRPHAAATAGRGRRGLRNVRFGPPASRHPLTRLLLLLLLSTHWLASGKCLLLLLLQEVALHQCVHERRLR